MTVTGTNLYAMAHWILEGCPKRVPPTDIRHLRRCMAGGLIDSALTVTPAGVDALRDSVTRHAHAHPTNVAALAMLDADTLEITNR